ncbi:L-asparagine transporter-like permease [Peribacillus simplex]
MNYFPKGWKGFWSFLIYDFYDYGGIEVIGLMAMRLKMKEDAPQAVIIMLIVLVVIYIISLRLAVYMAAHGAFNKRKVLL